QTFRSEEKRILVGIGYANREAQLFARNSDRVADHTHSRRLVCARDVQDEGEFFRESQRRIAASIITSSQRNDLRAALAGQRSESQLSGAIPVVGEDRVARQIEGVKLQRVAVRVRSRARYFVYLAD